MNLQYFIIQKHYENKRFIKYRLILITYTKRKFNKILKIIRIIIIIIIINLINKIKIRILNIQTFTNLKK